MSESRRAIERFVAGVRRVERLDRALLAAVATAGAVSVAGLLPSLAIAAGLRPPWWWSSAGLVAWIAAACAAAAVAAAALPVDSAHVTRDADRRLGLDGALSTARQNTASNDPICHLLLSRTARRIAGVPARRVARRRWRLPAMVVPALMVPAFVLTTRLPAAPQATTVPATQTATQAMSVGIDEVVSALLAGAPSAADTETARQLLAIDNDLRAGRLTAEQGREALAEIAERAKAATRNAAPPSTRPSSPDAASAGAAGGSSAAPEWAETLGRLVRDGTVTAAGLSAVEAPSAATARDTRPGSEEATAAGAPLTGGTGDGAGLGVAALGGTRPTGESGPVPQRPAATWSLPAGDGRGPFGPGDGSGRTVDTTAGATVGTTGRLWLGLGGRPLTDAEQRVVEAYFRALVDSREAAAVERVTEDPS